MHPAGVYLLQPPRPWITGRPTGTLRGHWCPGRGGINSGLFLSLLRAWGGQQPRVGGGPPLTGRKRRGTATTVWDKN